MANDVQKRPEQGDEKKTTFTLSLTVGDKKKLKVMAAQQETSIAAIIHEWVKEHSEEVDA
ncbi:MAG: hypothetical protein E6399_18825 [Clostridium sp.]|uniref:hypothetical protein n=1 Tax=Clostridium sp. TaxID=1506 RepID=UPI002906E77A|nr:hypothetical protein [Clostridium sp.]MDU6876503.1 hypothetical protein [Clostridium sp.]